MGRSRRFRWLSVAVAAGLGAVAFAGVERLRMSRHARLADGSPMLARPVRDVRIEHVALQVAVHEVIEAAGSPSAIRICRGLANQPVTLSADRAATLGTVVAQLARQLGATVELAVDRPGGRALPTIVCPHGVRGDYLTIGFSDTRRLPVDPHR